MNISALMIRNALKQKAEKKWDKLYWAIDLHDTIITGTYNRFNHGATIYPYAKEVLDFLHSHPEHQTILWSSSHDDALFDIIKRFDLRFNFDHEMIDRLFINTWYRGSHLGNHSKNGICALLL